MKIIPIFAPRLFSIQYDAANPSEFERLFDDWQDPELLYQFFTENEADLISGFFGTISIEQAALKTRAEARKLEEKLSKLAKSTSKSLDEVFIPLRNYGHEIEPFPAKKAYGETNKTWLRIYALKLEPGAYLITGGAIKLTKSMNQRDHTKAEIGKIDRCKTFLKEQGVGDFDGVLELSLE